MVQSISVGAVMRQPLQLGLELLDPRGRCNRRGLAWLAVAMLILQLALGLVLWSGFLAPQGTPASLAKLLFCWLAICAVSKRLHDLGRSAAWLGWGFLSSCLWTFAVALGAAFGLGMEHLTPSGRWFAPVMGLCMVPVVGALLWLHVAKGDRGANAYGPAPDRTGFSALDLERPVRT